MRTEPLLRAPLPAVCFALAALAAASAPADVWCPSAAACPLSLGAIQDPSLFLDQCPNSSDPVTQQVLADFELLLDGARRPTPEFWGCAGPVSEVPIDEWTDLLITVQTLRTIHELDLGSRHHLPWTNGSLYDWMKSKIAGFDIRPDATFNSCCEEIAGKLYVVLKPQDEASRELTREWRGIASRISLFAHEVRHVDGFAHVDCCPAGSNACDSTYDESNLSPYGIQFFLERAFLRGDLNVGVGCLEGPALDDIVNWHWSGQEGQADRFCENQPTVVSPDQLPGGPGGACGKLFVDGFDCDVPVPVWDAVAGMECTMF